MSVDNPTIDDVVTYSSGDHDSPPDLRILHYNDVYHVEPSSAEPVGGYARFKTLCNYYRSDSKFAGQSDLLTFFSGDAFNPSLESSVTKGLPELHSVSGALPLTRNRQPHGSRAQWHRHRLCVRWCECC